MSLSLLLPFFGEEELLQKCISYRVGNFRAQVLKLVGLSSLDGVAYNVNELGLTQS